MFLTVARLFNLSGSSWMNFGSLHRSRNLFHLRCGIFAYRIAHGTPLLDFWYLWGLLFFFVSLAKASVILLIFLKSHLLVQLVFLFRFSVLKFIDFHACPYYFLLQSPDLFIFNIFIRLKFKPLICYLFIFLI